MTGFQVLAPNDADTIPVSAVTDTVIAPEVLAAALIEQAAPAAPRIRSRRYRPGIRVRVMAPAVKATGVNSPPYSELDKRKLHVDLTGIVSVPCVLAATPNTAT